MVVHHDLNILVRIIGIYGNSSDYCSWARVSGWPIRLTHRAGVPIVISWAWCLSWPNYSVVAFLWKSSHVVLIARPIFGNFLFQYISRRRFDPYLFSTIITVCVYSEEVWGNFLFFEIFELQNP